jgi:hypothetical protein
LARREAPPAPCITPPQKHPRRNHHDQHSHRH